MGFLTPIFQSLLASAIYGAGEVVVKVFANRFAHKRYEKAFERAVCHFYADPEYAGNEARQHYSDYLKMLQDASRQDDILASCNQVYEKMLDLFVQEVSKDNPLQAYTIMRNIFTTQKRLGEITEKIKESINLAQANREENRQEHKEILEQINGLKELVKNPKMQSLTFAPLCGCAVAQNEQEAHIVYREKLVERCVTSLESGKILILHGALKVGKTTLAQMVAKKKKGVEIIDGVAERDMDAVVSDLLAARNEGKIIVTTTSALNKNLSTHDFSLIEQVEVPLLSVVETTDLISSFKPTSDLCGFIYSHTSGHPVLVKALCSYFSTCGWKFDADNFCQILSYSFDRNLKRSLSELISRIITDSETRFLLNRLMLIHGSFTEAEACKLAEIIPQIGEVRSRLYSLIPTWVMDNGGQLNISPLLNKLWQADISGECQKQCNKILSQNILSLNRPLTEQDVLNYINYSVRAKEYDDAGHMYITILNKLHDANEILPEKSLLRGIWVDMPLPVDMSLKVKIGFRLAQLLLLGGLSKGQRNYLLWDLKQLVENYEKDDFKAFFYCTVTLICWQENDVADGLKYYNLYNTSDKKETVTILSQFGEKISLFDNNIWVLLLRLTKVNDYETWLESFLTAHVNYSHDDREVCDCCYLSVSRLITYHLRESDIETKQSVLKRIWNKAEECKCPEMAIVSLFKILDLFAVSGGYDEAKVLYDVQYEKYKDYPLAVILLNGAMAYACYKTKNTSERNWCYFEQVIKFADKDLMPDIQLHIKEVFAYVVAKKDPEQSVVLLNEALEYANNENYRVDIFEYYQCKGELSYAYWCIGERSTAVELLSECVDFVLPLAEAEKNFAKTYLCLCNCLITKYCLDVQNKPLPVNQASPERGMFTENNLNGFDDLYTMDRLYVTCYQMSDLCENLQMNALAYKWAKKTVDACRRRGEVKETHYLLFLLVPLFKAEEDLDDIAFIIRHSDKARRLTYQLYPKMQKKSNDLEFVEFLIVPLLMEALVLKIRGTEMGIEVVKSIVKEYKAVSDKETIRLVKDIFERDTYDRAFIAEIKKLNVQERYSVYLCAYIMTAYYSDSDYAFDLLMAIMPELQKLLVQIYGTRIMIILNHYISSFWKERILRKPEEFNGYGRLKDRGLKLIDEYEGEINQANKTMMVVRDHLKLQHTMNRIQEDWLDV